MIRIKNNRRSELLLQDNATAATAAAAEITTRRPSAWTNGTLRSQEGSSSNNKWELTPISLFIRTLSYMDTTTLISDDPVSTADSKYSHNWNCVVRYDVLAGADCSASLSIPQQLWIIFVRKAPIWYGSGVIFLQQIFKYVLQSERPGGIQLLNKLMDVSMTMMLRRRLLFTIVTKKKAVIPAMTTTTMTITSRASLYYHVFVI